MVIDDAVHLGTCQNSLPLVGAAFSKKSLSMPRLFFEPFFLLLGFQPIKRRSIDCFLDLLWGRAEEQMIG